MKLLIALAVAGCALADIPGFDGNGRPTNRIVGGVEVSPPGKYPFMAQLPMRCGGSLISPDWVLTAAHCVNRNNPPSNGPASFERHLFGTGGISRNVTEVRVHPSYGGISRGSDAALLRISPAVKTVRPIPLDSGKGIYSQPGELNTVIGWGATSQGGPLSNTLQEVSLPVITNEVCGRVMDGVFPGAKIGDCDICMGEPQGGRDGCQGDSGGPMFYQQNGDSFGQTGVVSWGDGCARPNRYGVYARVSAMLDWIVENVPDVTVV